MIHPVYPSSSWNKWKCLKCFKVHCGVKPTTSIEKPWISWILNLLMCCEVLPYFTSFRAECADDTWDKLRQMPWWNHIAGSLQSGTPFLALLRKTVATSPENSSNPLKVDAAVSDMMLWDSASKNRSLRSRCSKPMILVMLTISALPKSPEHMNALTRKILLRV